MSICHTKGWPALCLGIFVISVVWMIVLPWIGSSQSIRSEIEFLDQRGVDPTALYYTDLQAMQRIESDLASISQKHPEAFWSVSSDRE